MLLKVKGSFISITCKAVTRLHLLIQYWKTDIRNLNYFTKLKLKFKNYLKLQKQKKQFTEL